MTHGLIIWLIISQYVIEVLINTNIISWFNLILLLWTSISNLLFDFVLGGHTSEILSLISTLSFAKYSPRHYVIANTDRLSADKVTLLERSKCSDDDDTLAQVYFGIFYSFANSKTQEGFLNMPRSEQVA